VINRIGQKMQEWKSETYRIKVGCGNLYCTVIFNADGSIHKVWIPRNSRFNCSLITRDSLSTQATYQARREPSQLIKDLKGSKAHCCEKYNITCQAYSCSDAVAKVVAKVLGSQGSESSEIKVDISNQDVKVLNGKKEAKV